MLYNCYKYISSVVIISIDCDYEYEFWFFLTTKLRTFYSIIFLKIKIHFDFITICLSFVLFIFSYEIYTSMSVENDSLFMFTIPKIYPRKQIEFGAFDGLYYFPQNERIKIYQKIRNSMPSNLSIQTQIGRSFELETLKLYMAHFIIYSSHSNYK